MNIESVKLWGKKRRLDVVVDAIADISFLFLTASVLTGLIIVGFYGIFCGLKTIYLFWSRFLFG